MKVRIKLAQPRYFALKLKMNATLTVEYDNGDERMVAIPSSAVIFDKSENFCDGVTRTNTTCENRPIEIYQQNADLTYVKSGLKPGEKW